MTANQIAYVKSQEERRHNYAVEAETYRADVAREQENSRANTLNYNLGMTRAANDYNASIYASQASMYNAQLNAQVQRERTEMERFAKQMERQETAWLNSQNVMLRSGEIAETRRHNQAMESTNAYNADTNKMKAIGEAILGAVKTGVSLGGVLRYAAG